MVLVPSGSFMMGQADEDIAASQINLNKRVTVSQFYMDDTEITNNEYRQFTDVMMKDSISVIGEEKIIAEAEVALDSDAILASSMAKAGNVLVPSFFVLGEPQGRPGGVVDVGRGAAARFHRAGAGA